MARYLCVIGREKERERERERGSRTRSHAYGLCRAYDVLDKGIAHKDHYCPVSIFMYLCVWKSFSSRVIRDSLASRDLRFKFVVRDS